ncbi:hypothetical protein BSLG_000806 [Batrachochytrium salamandrivorans]|nr:hypothetical protein BSLG_000806 [Batrachochytrium salamandrivorans]
MLLPLSPFEPYRSTGASSGAVSTDDDVVGGATTARTTTANRYYTHTAPLDSIELELAATHHQLEPSQSDPLLTTHLLQPSRDASSNRVDIYNPVFQDSSHLSSASRQVDSLLSTEFDTLGSADPTLGQSVRNQVNLMPSSSSSTFANALRWLTEGDVELTDSWSLGMGHSHRSPRPSLTVQTNGLVDTIAASNYLGLMFDTSPEILHNTVHQDSEMLRSTTEPQTPLMANDNASSAGVDGSRHATRTSPRIRRTRTHQTSSRGRGSSYAFLQTLVSNEIDSDTALGLSHTEGSLPPSDNDYFGPSILMGQDVWPLSIPQDGMLAQSTSLPVDEHSDSTPFNNELIQPDPVVSPIPILTSELFDEYLQEVEAYSQQQAHNDTVDPAVDSQSENEISQEQDYLEDLFGIYSPFIRPIDTMDNATAYSPRGTLHDHSQMVPSHITTNHTMSLRSSNTIDEREPPQRTVSRVHYSRPHLSSPEASGAQWSQSSHDYARYVPNATRHHRVHSYSQRYVYSEEATTPTHREIAYEQLASAIYAAEYSIEGDDGGITSGFVDANGDPCNTFSDCLHDAVDWDSGDGAMDLNPSISLFDGNGDLRSIGSIEDILQGSTGRYQDNWQSQADDSMMYRVGVLNETAYIDALDAMADEVGNQSEESDDQETVDDDASDSLYENNDPWQLSLPLQEENDDYHDTIQVADMPDSMDPSTRRPHRYPMQQQDNDDSRETLSSQTMSGRRDTNRSYNYNQPLVAQSKLVAQAIMRTPSGACLGR